MATRKQAELAVTNAGINVRGKTQTLEEAKSSLAESQGILADLQSRVPPDTQRILNIQVAIQRQQNAVKAAAVELNQAKTDLVSAQLELKNPEAQWDPEPTRATDAVTWTQEQRNRLDQINADRIEKDLTPLLPGDAASLEAVKASFAAEQTTQAAADRATASSQTAGDAVANSNGTPGGGQPVTPGQLDAEQQKILAILNANRVQQGLDPLSATSEQAASDIAELQQRQAALRASDQNTGTGGDISNYDKNDRLLASEKAKVSETVDPADDWMGTIPKTTTPDTPKPKDGWTNDGGVVVTMSGTNSSTKPTTIGASNTTIAAKPTENPLHAFASYTYGLSLHMLSPADYKKLVEAPGTKFKPSVTIIGGANRYNTTPPRDKAFADDFYFDSCKVSTNIGLSAAQMGTNALKIGFTLIEPYGMTFLNRILDLSVRMKIPNYLEIPYLLEISFFGSDDKGAFAKLEAQTKLIPIRLIALKIKAGTKGSEYVIDAVPYTQMAHLESLSATKANFEISSRTVGDYFANGDASKSFASDQQQVGKLGKYQAGLNQAAKDDKARETPGTSSAAAAAKASAGPATVKAGSFTNAFNLWQEYDVKMEYQRVADEIAFVIDPEISSATITEPAKANPARVAISAADIADSELGAAMTANARSANKPKPLGGDFTKGFFNINAGTSVVTVINNMITNSEFIRKQLGDALKSSKDTKVPDADAAAKMAGGTIQWFKIRTKIDLKEYDTKRGVYGKKITFYINKYTHYEARFPGIPKSSPKGSVKNYNYMYTGLNRDILDFSIDFNHLFATMATVDGSKQTQLVTNPTSAMGGGGKGNDLPGFSISPQQIAYQAATMSSITGGSDDDILKQRAANYAQNIYQGSQGDMINLKLKILGDPQFIKQDEILWSPDKIPSGSKYIGGDQGSIDMDSGEIHCNINFKTPVDIDETSGLLRKDSVWKDVYFSGYYQILAVESEFRQGKFTQTLECIRPHQEGDSKAQVPVTKPISSSSKGSPGANTGETRAVAFTDDNGFTLVANGDTTMLEDPDGNITETKIASASDRPGPDPLQQAARDNAATTDDYENAGMSSAPTGLPLPDELSADPNQAALRNVAQNGPTATIDSNSGTTGEPVVGAPPATTQAAAPATQTPPVQTAPQPAPATETQRQATAAKAQTDALTAQSQEIVNQYSALYADYKINLDKLNELSKVIAESDKLIAQTNNTEQLKQLVEVQRTAIAKQQAILDSLEPKRVELEKLSAANADIGKQIAAIKANATNEDAELNAAVDAADARQRATAKF